MAKTQAAPAAKTMKTRQQIEAQLESLSKTRIETRKCFEQFDNVEDLRGALEILDADIALLSWVLG